MIAFSCSKAWDFPRDWVRSGPMNDDNEFLRIPMTGLSASLSITEFPPMCHSGTAKADAFRTLVSFLNSLMSACHPGRKI